jgi:hypothetical protein
VLISTLSAAILYDGEDNGEEGVPEEKRAIFYAKVELAVR